jgi:REP element-mobilizing transposase RayT
MRVKGYDYSQSGSYFVTICSKNRENIFGKIIKKNVEAVLAPAWYQIELSIIGQIIFTQWQDIQNRYDNVGLDKFIIMPNHLHGIILINKKRVETSATPTIGQIIRSFNSISAREYLLYIKNNQINASVKIWQRSFYDRIIRGEESLKKIREYILNNPINWKDDPENPINF